MAASTRRRASPLLFKFDPLTMGLDYQGNPWAISGNKVITGTFDRGGTVGSASSIDANGRVFIPGYKSPRWYQSYDATTGLWLPRGILLEGSRVNLVTGSESFVGTGWSAGGTPTRSAAAHTASGVSLDLIGDDSAAAVEYYVQTVAFTGDAVKAVSIFAKEGTTPDGFVVNLADDSAPANRLIARITWASGVPTVTMTTGTHLFTRRCKDGVYRFGFASTSVTAANTNRLYIFPATTAAFAVANVGNVYAGGVQAENAAFPGEYIPTVGAALTRSADALSFAFPAIPQAMTVYVKFVESGGRFDNGYKSIYALTDSPGNSPFLHINGNATAYIAAHNNGSATRTTAASGTPATGDVVEMRHVVNTDGSTYLGSSINAAAEAVTSATAANTFASRWGSSGNALLSVASFGNYDFGFAVVGKLYIAAGVKTLAQMRAY